MHREHGGIRIYSAELCALWRLSATRLRADLYRVLDEILENGRPVEIERRGRILRIDRRIPWIRWRASNFTRTISWENPRR